jgi:hypothetical protein
VKRAAPPRSLLDDPFFLAELERLETDLPMIEKEIPGVYWQREPPVWEASDDGHGPDDPCEHLGQWDHSETAPPPVAAGTASWRAAVHAVQAGRTLLAIGGFVAMMLVGAAAAVVVFHDRVALILQTLR